jgi:hypothetical protein
MELRVEIVSVPYEKILPEHLYKIDFYYEVKPLNILNEKVAKRDRWKV